MYAYNSIKDKWSKGNWSKEIERTLILISHFEFCILNFPVCVCVLIAMSIFCSLSGSNIAVFFFFSVIVLRNFVNSLKYLKYVTVQFYFFFLITTSRPYLPYLIHISCETSFFLTVSGEEFGDLQDRWYCFRLTCLYRKKLSGESKISKSEIQNRESRLHWCWYHTEELM